MAETQPPKKKRRVRNPETFRERAIKASDESDKPTRSSRLKTAGGRVVKPVSSPAGKALKNVYHFKPFRPIFFVLRLIGKVILPPYIRSSWRELRLVKWPSRTESRQLTFAVIVFAVVFGAIISGVDYGLDKLFRNVLLK